MTASVTLSDGTNTVNFNDLATASDVNVSHRFSNPLITFDTPITTSLKIGENTVPINIGFVVNSFDMTFTLSDGPGTFNFQTPTTAYEKIMYMANYKKNVKTLTLNGTAFTGQVENVNITWESGKKNVAEGCTLSFHLTKDVKME